jgi:pimeloyl-ACP methyl ester carboxylesterase
VPTPFVIDIPQSRLDAISRKVSAYDWGALADAGGWSSGVGIADLKRLTTYWLERYDWRTHEVRLNRLPHFTAEIAGQTLHFIHARSDVVSGGRRPPVLLVHGWPGSFLEFEKLIEPLLADGHDVVVPSLPGYAFSGRPISPIGPRKTAELMHGLMTELYGDRKFFAQGGDWGASIVAWLAYQFPASVAGLHLNMVAVNDISVKPETAVEISWRAELGERMHAEMGYFQQQSTRPQTLNALLADSPVGVAAWIFEKFAGWADVPRDEDGTPDVWKAFDEDLLLTNIMLYLVTNAIVTSTWIYRGKVLEGAPGFAAGTGVSVPTGVAAFPDPLLGRPLRSYTERSYNVVHWSEFPSGGHFAALEQPDVLLADLRQFCRLVESLG